jgi:RNA polymerase sigma factor (sigma-70 family)
MSASTVAERATGGPVIDGVRNSSAADRHLPDLAELTEATRLSAAQEFALFDRLRELERYARFVSDLAAVAEEEVSPLRGENRAALAQARDIRDAIVRVFLKLAAGAVRPFLCPRFSFDELNSEACITLLKSVEMFDHQRGFRFSTYATTAIRRQLERYVINRRREQRHLGGGAVDQFDGVQGRPACSSAEETRRGAWLCSLWETFSRLGDRDQRILTRRFGLDADVGAATLQILADELGVSRERVRQLESRALKRLRGIAQADGWLEA